MLTLTREEYMPMRAYIIDPDTKTVREVEHDGTPASLATLYRGKEVKCQVINSGGDALMFDPSVRDDECTWSVPCMCGCGSVVSMGGIAIIYGTIRNDLDTIEEPTYSIRGYRECIEWLVPGEHVVGQPITMTLEEALTYLTKPRH